MRMFDWLIDWLILAVLGPRFCARAFSSCGKRGPLFIAMRGPLSLRSTGSRRAGSAIVAHGPSCSAACGILPAQGSNPCSLHWQADSQPLRHQGSPIFFFFNEVVWWCGVSISWCFTFLSTFFYLWFQVGLSLRNGSYVGPLISCDSLYTQKCTLQG